MLLQRALAIYKQCLNPDHPDIARSLNNLGKFYAQREKFTEAEPLYLQSLAIYKQMDADHPYTANSLHNLAALYVEQKKYAEAEPLYERALSIRKTEVWSRSSRYRKQLEWPG